MLTRITLSRGEYKHLPRLGGLRSLKYLTVHHMRYMECIALRSSTQLLAGEKEFPSLTELQFVTMPKWSEWSGADAGKVPMLNTLWLSLCPKLSSLPLGPFPCLITLKLTCCYHLATFPASPALRKLEIEDCSALRESPTLPSLLELRVRRCPCLSSLPTLPSLLKQHISGCPSLISIWYLKLTTMCSQLSSFTHHLST
jgi:hypothetical protein